MDKDNGSGRDFYHDFPPLLAFCQALVSLPRALERKRAVHNRPELSLSESPHDLRIFRGVAHRRTHDGPVMPEQPAQIEARPRTGGRAARHEPAATPQAAER